MIEALSTTYKLPAWVIVTISPYEMKLWLSQQLEAMETFESLRRTVSGRGFRLNKRTRVRNGTHNIDAEDLVDTAKNVNLAVFQFHFSSDSCMPIETDQ